MLPNLIIIGAMKAGTTSLHHYLGLHPQISMSRRKEPHFFVAEMNWSRGVKWYERHFTGDAVVYGESSTGYSNFPAFRGVPKRIHSVVPDVRFIYVLRDPIERAVSHYVQACAIGRESRPFKEAVWDRAFGYLDRGLYHTQLEQYLGYFPCSRVLLMAQEELLDQRRQALRRAFRFLGLDQSFDAAGFDKLWHRSDLKRRPIFANLPGVPELSRLPERARWLLTTRLPGFLSYRIDRPVITADLRARLMDVFRDDVERLRVLTGMSLTSWSV